MKTYIVNTVVLCLALGVASTAHAIAKSEGVVVCENNIPDAGIQVQVVKNTIGLFPNPEVSYVANVSESTIAGPRNLGSFEVQFEQADTMGAPQYYRGQDLVLEIESDTAPVNGHTLGHFSIKTDSLRISDDVSCLLK